MSRTIPCPGCGQLLATAKEALRCWLSHDPTLAQKRTLQSIGDQLGVTRERVRQILNALGIRERTANLRRLSIEQEMLEEWTALAAQPPVRVKVRRYDWLDPERCRAYYREREKDPRRKEYKKRRHQERWAQDPEYREKVRAKRRRKYFRRKMRLAQQAAQSPGQ